MEAADNALPLPSQQLQEPPSLANMAQRNAGKPRTQKRRGHAAIVAPQTLGPEAQAVARLRGRAAIL